MKLQETLYRREGHKEYSKGYAGVDWSIDTPDKQVAIEFVTKQKAGVKTSIMGVPAVVSPEVGIHDRCCGESDVLRQLEFEEIQAPEYIYDEARQEYVRVPSHPMADCYENVEYISEEPIDINKMGDTLVAFGKHCSNCEHYDNCNTFGKAGDRADKCGTYTKRGE